MPNKYDLYSSVLRFSELKLWHVFYAVIQPKALRVFKQSGVCKYNGVMSCKMHSPCRVCLCVCKLNLLQMCKCLYFMLTLSCTLSHVILLMQIFLASFYLHSRQAYMEWYKSDPELKLEGQTKCIMTFSNDISSNVNQKYNATFICQK